MLGKRDYVHFSVEKKNPNSGEINPAGAVEQAPAIPQGVGAMSSLGRGLRGDEAGVWYDW